MTVIETHRAFVNTWECDENAHLNVQFYWKRFGEASQIFFQKTGRPIVPWLDRHVLYHGELMGGTTTIIRSKNTDSGIVHTLTNGEDDTESATAFEPHGDAGKLHDIPESTRPRSLPLNPLSIVNAEEKIAAGLGLVTHMSTVTPAECDNFGNMLDQYYISRFSDAAAHLWNFFGIKRSWMHDNQLGSAAVEMKVTRHAAVLSGTIIEIASWIETVRDKTFSFRHQVRDMKSGEVLYSGAVTALVMDLKKRKAIPVPDAIAAFR